MKPTRVCITGAGGFIGSALAEGFATLGWDVTALDRAFDDATSARLGNATLLTCDLSHGVPTGATAADLFVHAAAVTTDPETLGWTPAAHLGANLRPLLAVLEHATRTPPAAFVFISSSGVFAPGDGDDGLRDADRPTARSPYAIAKRSGEQLVPVALEGVAAAHVVRLGYVYGPHESARPSRARVSPVAQWLADARHGRPLMVRADDPAREWTFSEDLAPALARVISGPAAGHAVHLCSPHVLRDSEMARLVAERFPGVRLERSSSAAAKAPMRPSDLACLAGFAWTTPAAGLARLAAIEVAA